MSKRQRKVSDDTWRHMEQSMLHPISSSELSQIMVLPTSRRPCTSASNDFMATFRLESSRLALSSSCSNFFTSFLSDKLEALKEYEMYQGVPQRREGEHRNRYYTGNDTQRSERHRNRVRHAASQSLKGNNHEGILSAAAAAKRMYASLQCLLAHILVGVESKHCPPSSDICFEGRSRVCLKIFRKETGYLTSTCRLPSSWLPGHLSSSPTPAKHRLCRSWCSFPS